MISVKTLKSSEAFESKEFQTNYTTVHQSYDYAEEFEVFSLHKLQLEPV
jgi:hypothetical protein